MWRLAGRPAPGGEHAAGPGREPSFLEALRETVRTAFGDEPPSEEELFRLVREHLFDDALGALQLHPRLWSARDENGHSLLHWAALGGCLRLVSDALRQGTPADVRGASGQTPLMWAVCGGHVDVAEALVDAGADLQARGSAEEPLAAIAVQHRRLELLPFLVACGGEGSLDSRNRSGCSAAHWAAHAGDAEALRLLATLRADLQARDLSGRSPVHCAVIGEGGPQALSLLVDRHADLASCDSEGLDCFALARQRQSPEVEALLLSLTAGRLLRPRPAGDEPADHAPALPPMATGVAVYYAGAEGTAARQHEAEGASFELGPATCWEQLSRDLLRELASARGHPGAVQCGPGARGAGGPEEVDVGGAGAGCRGDGCVAWLVATDSSGAHVDLLSQRASPLPGPERWPLSVRAVPVRGEAAPPGEAPIEVPAGPGAAGGAAALGRAPPGARWRAWAELLGLRHCSFPKGDEYDRLSQEQNQWTELIRTDVARTFAWLSEADKQVLRRVLNACAAHCPDVGYCQGMNLVAGALLYASASVPETPEEEILGALTALLQRLGLRGFYSEGLPLLRCYLEAGDQLLRELAPALREHLRDEGVDVRMYLQQWLMALFVDCVPLQVAAGLWDAILLEGLPFALRAAVGLLRSLEGRLLGMRSQEILAALRSMRGGGAGPDAWKIAGALAEQAARVQIPEHLRESLCWAAGAL